MLGDGAGTSSRDGLDMGVTRLRGDYRGAVLDLRTLRYWEDGVGMNAFQLKQLQSGKTSFHFLC